MPLDGGRPPYRPAGLIDSPGFGCEMRSDDTEQPLGSGSVLCRFRPVTKLPPRRSTERGGDRQPGLDVLGTGQGEEGQQQRF